MECAVLVIGGLQPQFSAAFVASAKRETWAVIKFTVVSWAKMISFIALIANWLWCGLQEKD